MAIYVNTETLEFPQYVGHIQDSHPDWDDYDNPPAPWVAIVETPLPPMSDNQVIDRDFVVQQGNQWVRQWEIRTLTPEQQQERIDAAVDAHMASTFGLPVAELESFGLTSAKLRREEAVRPDVEQNAAQVPVLQGAVDELIIAVVGA